jgi:two-component system NarL family sensor kinase
MVDVRQRAGWNQPSVGTIDGVLPRSLARAQRGAWSDDVMVTKEDVTPTLAPTLEQPAPWVRLADEQTPLRQRHAIPSARRVVVQFFAASLVAALVLLIISLVVSRRAATDEALRDARHTTDVLAEAVVTPNLSNAVVHERPAALASLDHTIHRAIAGSSIVRVKLWNANGTIIYSDEPRLIGSTYGLGEDDLNVLRHGGTEAEISDLTQPENRFERSQGKLLEVYRQVRTPSGQPLLFETYARYQAVSSRTRDLLLSFAPITIGVLLLLQLIQMPLARRMTRQLRQGEVYREALSRRAADASDDERRRIAGSLHDGVVQDLAGASFVLAGAVDTLEKAPSRAKSTDVVPSLRRALSAVRESIGGLRSTLVEIYPPSLRTAGIESALSDLTAPLSGRGITVSVEFATDLVLPPECEALIFRVTQETLRNVVQHSSADRVELRLDRTPTHAVLTIADNGVGFDASAMAMVAPEGHFGLRVLRDLADDAGTSLEVSSAPGRGTWLRLGIPLP